MTRVYNFKEYEKFCRSCGSTFMGHSNRQYCSTKCRDTSDQYKAIHQKSRISNLEFFLKEKIKLASHRGKYPVTITYEELRSIWDLQKGLCALSGVPMTYLKGSGRIPTNLSMDRIDSSLPYSYDNVQLVCYQANLMKSELNTEALWYWCERILDVKQKA